MTAIEFFKDSTKAILKELSKSPTFAMSLGAKELFHTNFLAFLLETDQETLKRVSTALKHKLFGDRFDGAVWVFRESKNMDLIVVPQNPKADSQYSSVVIEAKMKSVPSISQLDGYDIKLDQKNLKIGEVDHESYDVIEFSTGNTVRYRVKEKQGNKYQWDIAVTRKIRRIILAPLNPYDNDEQLSKSERWEYWSWKVVSELLAKVVGSMNDNDDRMVYLVKNYSDDLDQIDKLLAGTKKFVDCYCSRGSDLIFKAFNETLLEPFKKARIHDLISKYAYSRLAQEIQKQFKSENFGVNFGVYFSRGTPILEIAKHIDSQDHKREIGVQIQGGQYRHFILSRKPDEALRGFSNDRIGWFELADHEVQNVHGLNKFDDEKFLYSKKKMDGFTFDTLCNELKNSFKNCPDH